MYDDTPFFSPYIFYQTDTNDTVSIYRFSRVLKNPVHGQLKWNRIYSARKKELYRWIKWWNQSSFLLVVLMCLQILHLQAEQLQWVHGHDEPQLVFSSRERRKQNRRDIHFDRYFLRTYASMICNHICMRNYHRICTNHFHIQHHIHIHHLYEPKETICEYSLGIVGTYFCIGKI